MESAQIIITEPVKQNLWWLIKHSFNILFKHNSRNERISKWERLVASMLIWLIGIVSAMLALFLGWGTVVWVILAAMIYIAVTYYLLKLLKQRFNDLNLWAKGMRRVIGWIIVTVITWLIAWTMAVESIITTIVFGLISLVALSFVLWYKLLTQFENGSQWNNKYGADPMTRQPHSNKPYIIFGAIIPAIMYLVLMLIVLASGAMMNTTWINSSILWELWERSALIPSDSMNYINIDSTKPIDDQIDTEIQTEDESALTNIALP